MIVSKAYDVFKSIQNLLNILVNIFFWAKNKKQFTDLKIGYGVKRKVCARGVLYFTLLSLSILSYTDNYFYTSF